MPYDPTKTTAIRRSFIAQINRRWNAIKRDIRVSIIDNDVFGIQKLKANASLPPGSFTFYQDPEKIAAFMQWLLDQEAAGILQVTGRTGRRLASNAGWTDTYIDTAYQKGIRRAYAELHRAGYETPLPIEMAFNRPVHVSRVSAAYTRTWEDLKSVVEITNSRIRRAVSETLSERIALGLAEGKNPKVIARELYADLAQVVDSIGINRSRLIARTEVIRAHHKATMEEYRQAEVEGVSVQAEFLTAGDDRVCEECASLEGRVFTLAEIENLIPRHPQCRCSAIPAAKSVEVRAA